MATLVIHGTMTLLGAQHCHWWWNSWRQRGFLDAVSGVMKSSASVHDVWHINGAHVAQIPQLQRKTNWLTGRAGQLSTYQGHFLWDGSDDYGGRARGAGQLVDYLNQVVSLAPRERVFIIAHSHGCNLVKMASSARNLGAGVFIHKAVFLACPHFEAQGRGVTVYSYQANPKRFGRILNLSSETDTVQVGFADTLPGIPGYHVSDFYAPTAHRVDRDPQAVHVYDNWTIPTAARGAQAHTVMHGAAIGLLAGRWLATNESFKTVLQTGGNDLLPVAADDIGE